jgi:hypothetical protein
MTNDTSTLSNNGEASTQTSKRKSARKSGSSARQQTPAITPKRSPARNTGPVEILFTQEPNPYHTPQPPYIWIDYPTQSETLRATAYVVRLGVGGADLVEISIDKSPWLPCRLTSGYWWYDWSKIAKGKHTLVARMRTPDGRWYKTPIRSCTLTPE